VYVSRKIILDITKNRKIEPKDEYKSIKIAMLKVFLDNSEIQVKQRVLPILNKLFCDKIGDLSLAELHSDIDEENLQTIASNLFFEKFKVNCSYLAERLVFILK